MATKIVVARRSVMGLAIVGVLTAGGVYGVLWRASSIINRLLRDWAVRTVAQQSDSVYRFDPGRVHLNWPRGRVVVDSMSLVTNRGINGHRRRPRADLNITLYGCTINGVRLGTLVFGAGLVAKSFGCRAGSASVEAARPVHDRTAAAPRSARAGPAGSAGEAFLVLKQSVRLPSYAPRIKIAQITFPDLSFGLRLPHMRRGETRLELGRLQWRMADLVIDPADTAAATRPLFSRTVELVADNFVGHPDSATAVRVGFLRASLTDSTLELRDIGFAPTVTDAQFARSRRYRRDLIKITVGRTTAQGVDFGVFSSGEGVRARRLEVDSFRAEITSDKRRPGNPVQGRHRTPQGWMADLDETLSLDSVVVRDGEVVYREHSTDRGQPGVITFARIQATAANVQHVVGRQTHGDAMVFAATSQLQNAGRLDVRFRVPLDAPRFDMTFRGTLGPMPATAFNPFIEEVYALSIANGRVTGIGFDAAVRGGVARGTITPRYNDFSIAVTRRGSGGILGGGGIVGGAARGIASFAANQMSVRANNPDNSATTPRAGTIQHIFTPNEALPGFLWATLRDGLLQVIRK